MAKNTNHSTGDENLEAIQSTLSRSEQFIEENQKSVSIIIAAVIFIVVGYFAFQKFYIAPLEEEAQSQMFMAQNYFEQDSFKLALEGDGFNEGFLTIADEYNMTNSGALANYYTGISYLRLGQFDEAIDYLKKFDVDDELITTMTFGAIAAAYVEKGEFDDAVSYYAKASKRKTNEFVTPVFLFKLGLVYEELKKNDKASEAYKTIKTEYPKSNEARKIDKYIERVK